MQAGELRIGNLIQKHNGEIFTVTGKFLYECEEFGLLNTKYLTNPPKEVFKPIPLTEEWLIKFGVEELDKTGTRTDYKIGDGYFEFKIESSQFGVSFIIGNLDLELKYVHQLQNIYFALTGQELTIKEPINK